MAVLPDRLKDAVAAVAGGLGLVLRGSLATVRSMKLAAVRLPPPAMFLATMFGLPGICSPMKRASRRA